MKKILLILICLFVSFEASSKYDDLSGLKLLCENERFFLGFDFFTLKIKKYSDTRVNVYYFDRKSGLFSETQNNYLTNSSEIIVLTKPESITINRQNPKGCEKFSGDLKSFLKNKADEINEKLKSNQKF